MIFVVGSTGLLGGTICWLLAKKGIPISTFVRDSSDPIKVERLKGYGANIAKGDLRDPFSLNTACTGAESRHLYRFGSKSVSRWHKRLSNRRSTWHPFAH